jgi:antitoxin (DNA-binding transcriptional repressor) of toxin-antitoxin stability system
MSTITIEEAQAKLPEIIDKLAPGEAVVITRDQLPVAQLTPPPLGAPQPVFGSCKGKLIILAEDDEHLVDFQEYMP